MFTEMLDKYLVEDWRKAPKWLSVWVLLLIGLAPDLFNLAVQYKLISAGSVPGIFEKALNLAAFIGIAVRMIDQAAIAKGLLPAPKDSGDSGNAPPSAGS